MNSTSIAWSDFLYRRRLQTLQTVEDMLLTLEQKLEANGQDNTYWLFTSDHGYHLGMFGLALDKRTNYEQDLRVPFFIKGPNVRAANHTQTALNIDIVPTLVDLAGGQLPSFLDGLSLKPALLGERRRRKQGKNTQEQAVGESLKMRAEQRQNEEEEGEAGEMTENDLMEAGNRRPLFLVQYFGSNGQESGGNGGVCNLTQTYGSDWLQVDCFAQSQYSEPPFFQQYQLLPFCNCQDSANQTYTCLREAKTSSQWVFCTFITGEMEYYDLYADPYQLNNTAALLNPKWIASMKNVIERFLACAGHNCTWLDYDHSIPRY